MINMKTLLFATMLALAITEARAESLACYVQFGDVRFTGVDHRVVLLPYDQCMTYVGRDGDYIRGRGDWRGPPREGWIYAGDVACGPGSCRSSIRPR
jgi:hypothetical protein